MDVYASVDAARVAAEVARGTWENAEAGKPVRDGNLRKIGKALRMREAVAAYLEDNVVDVHYDVRASSLILTRQDGTSIEQMAFPIGGSESSVGGNAQDASGDEDEYVSASGAKVEAGITNADLLREILRSRADSDQIRAEQREQRQLIDSLSDRMARLEQPRT